MTLLTGMFMVGLLSILSFWKPDGKLHSILFLLTAGCSLVFAFYLYKFIPTPLGLTFTLVTIGYALVCLGYAYKLLFNGSGK